MKKSVFSVTFLILAGYGIGLVTRLATSMSIHSLNASALFSGVFICGLLLMACSDYSRKPRFRVRSPDESKRPATPATAPEADAASAWTYTTLSA